MERLTMWYDGNHAICENGECSSGNCPFADPICEQVQNIIDRLATYEGTGLEPEEIKEFAEDVIRQFAYHGQVNGRCAYTAGGLSTLEWAFQICGWDDPHPCPECECEVKNCHEWATGGRPTPDGYKWLCSRHYLAYEAREEALKAREQND